MPYDFFYLNVRPFVVVLPSLGFAGVPVRKPQCIICESVHCGLTPFDELLAIWTVRPHLDLLLASPTETRFLLLAARQHLLFQARDDLP